jgi:phosphoribosyl-ATP pyrophosphohydrolase/phosphoribosyl-AMP cyclohydrolase
MSPAALERTLQSGETWLWSRSRNELWHKGETSGNTQAVRAVRLDCDGDALLLLVDPAGPACHTGAETCFFDDLAGTSEPAEAFTALRDLERVVAARAEAGDGGSSYTVRLLARGVDTMGKKVGEEATEVAMAAKGGEREQLVHESADLIYHLVVLWRALGVGVEEVAQELAARRRGPEGGA